MERSANEALVRRFIQEIWNEGDMRAVEEIVAPGVLGIGPGPARMHGVRAIKFFLGDFMPAMGDATGEKWDYQIDDVFVDGDKVAVRMTDRSSVVSYQSRALAPERAEQALRETGLQVEAHGYNTAIIIFHLTEGLITRCWMEASPTPDIGNPGLLNPSGHKKKKPQYKKKKPAKQSGKM